MLPFFPPFVGLALLIFGLTRGSVWLEQHWTGQASAKARAVTFWFLSTMITMVGGSFCVFAVIADDPPRWNEGERNGFAISVATPEINDKKAPKDVEVEISPLIARLTWEAPLDGFPDLIFSIRPSGCSLVAAPPQGPKGAYGSVISTTLLLSELVELRSAKLNPNTKFYHLPSKVIRPWLAAISSAKYRVTVTCGLGFRERHTSFTDRAIGMFRPPADLPVRLWDIPLSVCFRYFRDFDGFRILQHAEIDHPSMIGCETDASSQLPYGRNVVAIWRDRERVGLREALLLLAGVIYGVSGALLIEALKAIFQKKAD